MTYAFIAQRCSDLPVALCCRAMKVSTSAFYAWRANPVSERDFSDALLTNTIVDIHTLSRGTYGSPRVHAELHLGLGERCSKKRVERLMRQAGRQGVFRRRRRGCTVRDPEGVPSDCQRRRYSPARRRRNSPPGSWVERSSPAGPPFAGGSC